MLALTHQILTEKMNEVVARIQANIQNKPVGKHGAMNASGKTAQSIHYEISENEVRLYGAKHIFALEFGRGPTMGGGGGESLRDRIRAWIDEKPVDITLPTRKDGTARKHRDGSNLTIEEHKDSVAYAISRKIHNTGTELFRAGGNSGILSDVINEDTLQGFYDALFYEFEAIVTSTLLEK